MVQAISFMILTKYKLAKGHFGIHEIKKILISWLWSRKHIYTNNWKG